MNTENIRTYPKNIDALPLSKNDVDLVERAKKSALTKYRWITVFIVLCTIVLAFFAVDILINGTSYRGKGNTFLVIIPPLLALVKVFFEVIKDTKESTGFIKKGRVSNSYINTIDGEYTLGNIRERREYFIDISFENGTVFLNQQISKKDYKKMRKGDSVALVTFDNDVVHAILIN